MQTALAQYFGLESLAQYFYSGVTDKCYQSHWIAMQSETSQNRKALAFTTLIKT